MQHGHSHKVDYLSDWYHKFERFFFGSSSVKILSGLPLRTDVVTVVFVAALLTTEVGGVILGLAGVLGARSVVVTLVEP